MHTVMLGELSRTGEGERPAGEPMPHAVFSAQILPSSIKAAPQADHERIPTTSEKDRELIAMLRAAARSAVREWRSRGVEPTQRLLIDMDVYSEEVAPLLETHLSAAEADNKQMAAAGLSIPAIAAPAAHEHAERLCYHAIRTAKGLAVSPTNAQRLIARAMSPGGGEHYDARDMVKFVVGLRAIADTVPEVKALLARTPETVTSADFAPVVALLRNCAGMRAGRVRVRDDGTTLSEVTREDLAGLTPARVAAVRQALDEISEAAGLSDRRLSITEDHAGLLVLPPDIAADLAKHGLTYAEWRNIGGWGAAEPPMGQELVLFEPRLVALRKAGLADPLVEALEPRIIGEHPDYEYSPRVFLDRDRGLSVVGMTPRTIDLLGAHNEVASERQRCADLHRERNSRTTISKVV